MHKRTAAPGLLPLNCIMNALKDPKDKAQEISPWCSRGHSVMQYMTALILLFQDLSGPETTLWTLPIPMVPIPMVPASLYLRHFQALSSSLTHSFFVMSVHKVD